MLRIRKTQCMVSCSLDLGYRLRSIQQSSQSRTGAGKISPLDISFVQTSAVRQPAEASYIKEITCSRRTVKREEGAAEWTRRSWPTSICVTYRAMSNSRESCSRTWPPWLTSSAEVSARDHLGASFTSGSWGCTSCSHWSLT